jgi:hypothetical protein
MVDVRITGANQLHDLGKRLKAEGEAGKGLRKELLKEIRAEAKPMAAAAKAEILAMPTHGSKHTGLRSKIAGKVRVRTRLSGRMVGVKIAVGQVDGTYLPRRINKGSWRHPVHGTDVWVEQEGHKGWFDDTLRKKARDAQRGIQRAMERVADRITHN